MNIVRTKTSILRTILFLGSLLPPLAALYAQPQLEQTLWPEGYSPSFARLRDTVFILDSTFLEVRLDRQMIYQHFRSGRVDVYPCSTGDPRIKDGIATRPGIFTIQWKSKKSLSQQFQVFLNYWMPFDGGIGFHGLDGRSYYKYLGRRPSSHGCVRISNETGAKLFKNVSSGTVVFVHHGSPARMVGFGDSSLVDLELIYTIDDALFKQRLEAVSTGRWYDPSLTKRLAIPARRKFTGKIMVGSVDPDLVVQYPLPIAGIEVVPTAPVSRLAPMRRIPLLRSDDELAEAEISGIVR